MKNKINILSIYTFILSIDSFFVKFIKYLLMLFLRNALGLFMNSLLIIDNLTFIIRFDIRQEIKYKYLVVDMFFITFKFKRIFLLFNILNY